MSDQWICADCGHVPIGKGRPPVNTCPRCRGDFTWLSPSDQRAGTDHQLNAEAYEHWRSQQ